MLTIFSISRFLKFCSLFAQSSSLLKINVRSVIEMNLATLSRKTNYLIVFRDLLAGFCLLFLPFAASRSLASFSLYLNIVFVMFFSIWFGTWIHYLSTFFHEAAHDNLAPKVWNDFLANYLIGPFVGLDIISYKRSHALHHKNLGTLQDTEISYYNSLDLRFISESFLLLKVFKYFYGKNQGYRSNSYRNSIAAIRSIIFIILTACAIFICSGVILSVSWLAGLLLISPGISSTRQLLEHRPLSVPRKVNLATLLNQNQHCSENLYAITRNFGHGLIARILGGAGLNYHELHHLYPSISYTNFIKLNKLLRKRDSFAYDANLKKSTYGNVLFRFICL